MCRLATILCLLGVFCLGAATAGDASVHRSADPDGSLLQLMLGINLSLISAAILVCETAVKEPSGDEQ